MNNDFERDGLKVKFYEHEVSRSYVIMDGKTLVHHDQRFNDPIDGVFVFDNLVEDANEFIDNMIAKIREVTRNE